MLSAEFELYIWAKHIAGKLESTNASDDVSAIWITNDGLSWHDTHLTFQELANVLRDLAQLADELLNLELKIPPATNS